MQALMLAAGMGRRMGKYTEAMTKCMIEVGGRTLLQRAVDALKEAGITKFVIVVGWKCDQLVDYIQNNISGMDFQFIYNYDYATTNNIYSLYLARNYLAQDDTILLESDLVYETVLLKKIVEDPRANLVAVAKYEHWMDGTVTTLDEDGNVLEFIEKKDFIFQNIENYYKTVNIYKFSKVFSSQQYLPFLEAYIKAYGKNQYYEMVLKTLAHLSQAQLKAFILKNVSWYEVDNAEDLEIANTMFAAEESALSAYGHHYGGYWRFPKLKDFCYLVNPYFPPKKMEEQMQSFYHELLTQYPSGMEIQRLLAGKMFSIYQEYVLVGNGAAELIDVLGRVVSGKMTLPVPAFNEYIRCFRNCQITKINSKNFGYSYDIDYLCKVAANTDIITIVNPDNPSGAFLKKEQIINLLDICREYDTLCIFDESFIDFAEPQKRYTLLTNQILEKYPNLIVIKSISKSYGVPGIRLGVLASSNTKILTKIKELMPIWNINSFAEYFLQIYDLYAKSYQSACDQIAARRLELMDELEHIPFLKPYPSQANYIMCRITNKYSAKELATLLLRRYQLLIKDLSSKGDCRDGELIRIAVKNEAENQLLIQALKEL